MRHAPCKCLQSMRSIFLVSFAIYHFSIFALPTLGSRSANGATCASYLATVLPSVTDGPLGGTVGTFRELGDLMKSTGIPRESILQVLLLLAQGLQNRGSDRVLSHTAQRLAKSVDD